MHKIQQFMTLSRYVPSRLLATAKKKKHTLKFRSTSAPVAYWIRRLPPEEEIAGSSPASGAFSTILKCRCERASTMPTDARSNAIKDDEVTGNLAALQDNNRCSHGRKPIWVHAQQSLRYLRHSNRHMALRITFRAQPPVDRPTSTSLHRWRTCADTPYQYTSCVSVMRSLQNILRNHSLSVQSTSWCNGQHSGL